VLQKGDLVIAAYNQMALVYEEPPVTLYAPSHAVVIRPTAADFCSEYLYLYLNSERVQTVLESEKREGLGLRIRAVDLQAFPITVPERECAHYQYTFFADNFPMSYFNQQSPLPIVSKQIPKDSLVFISYSSKDSALAQQTRQVLETNHIPCWMAPESIPPGSSYADKIPKAIAECKVFLLILSQASQESYWVPKEISLAVGNGKIIIPFQIENTAITDTFNFLLTDCQRIAAYNRTSEAYKELVQRLYDLLS
jgi:hypothetical protein